MKYSKTHVYDFIPIQSCEGYLYKCTFADFFFLNVVTFVNNKLYSKNICCVFSNQISQFTLHYQPTCSTVSASIPLITFTAYTLVTRETTQSTIRTAHGLTHISTKVAQTTTNTRSIKKVTTRFTVNITWQVTFISIETILTS